MQLNGGGVVKGKVKAIIVGLMLSVLPLVGQETISSVDPIWGKQSDETFPAGLFKFEDADLKQVLNTYRELSGRTIVRSTSLPQTKISVESQTSLTRTEALQLLDSVLTQNGIVMIPQGTKFVKAVSLQLAPMECPPLVTLPADKLPDCGTYICYMVEIKNGKASDIVAALQPHAKMPNSIMAMDKTGLIVIRDFSSNVRRMLQVIEKLDRAEK